MKCRGVRLENIGPIASGEIRLGRVTVLFGPNNAGKSIASRLIHAAQVLGSPRSMKRSLGRGAGRIGGADLLRIYGEAVLLHSALPREALAADMREPCALTVLGGTGAGDVRLDFGAPGEACSRYVDELYNPDRTGRARDSAVYIPAGRAGTVQAFTEMAYQRMMLAEYALYAAARGAKRALAAPAGRDPPKMDDIVPPRAGLPPHMEQFHDLVRRTLVGGPGRSFNRSLSRIFGGTIVKGGGSGAPRDRVAYLDPSGRRTPLSSAGSGILAAAPLLAGLHYAAPGGTLIVEEPEAHVEPAAQLALIGEAVSVALSKNVRLVLATHSEYVVRKILALVAGRKLRASDAALYEFRRRGTARAGVARIPVDPAGAAEQETFRRALDALVDEFSSG